MTALATAWVKIRSDTSSVRPETERALSADMDKVGVTAGKALSESLARTLQENLAKSGSKIADDFAKGFNDRVKEQTKDTQVGPAPEKSRKKGEESGGFFADSFAKKLKAADLSLPPIPIGPSLDAADQKVRDLHTQIRELSSQRIGVDIDSAAAVAKVRELSRELADLSRDSADIQVRADIGAAAAQLAAVGSLIDDVDGRTARLGATAHNSRVGFDVLVAAGAAIGPAIVPAVAAATAAVLGLGATAASVFAAVPVGALAFSGISDAVKALDGAQKDADKSAASLAGAQNSVANAADSVRNAEAALANTRSSVADASRRAAQSVRDAEEDLTRAQRDARDVTLQLDDARKQASDRMRELTQTIEENSLSQRQANLDIAEAKKALDKVLADPKATAEQREQAEITYQRQVLHMKDLKARGTELADEQKKNAKAGVEGSKEVLAVRKQQASADERVRDAEKRVSEARAQQTAQARQGAYQIQQAQRAVAAAQRSVEAATVSAGVAGSAAMDKLNEAMSKLSPAGQSFAKFIFSLKDEFQSLRNAAQDGALPGFERAIKTLLPYLPQVRDFIGEIAVKLGDFAESAADGLTSPYWRDFFSMIRSEAVPSLDRLWKTAGNVVRGFAEIVQAFAPLNADLGDGLVDLTAKFRRWAESLDQTEGFQRFLAYIQTEGPRVLSTIGSVATALLDIVEASGPLGSVSLTILKAIADAISAIPTPVLATLVTIIAGLTVGYKLWTVATLAQSTALRLFGGAAGGAAAQTGALNKQVGAATKSGGGVGLLGKLVGGLGAAAGPAGLAVAAAGIAIAGIASTSASYRAKVDGLKTSLLSLGDAFKQVGSNGKTGGDAVREAFTQIIASNPDLQKGVVTLDRLGVGFETLASAASGSSQDMSVVLAAVNAELDRLGKEFDTAFLKNPFDQTIPKQIQELERFKKALLENVPALQLQAQALDLVNSSTGRLDDSQTKLIRGSGPVSVETARKLAEQYNTNAVKIDVLTKLTEAFATTQGNATIKADALRNAIKLQTDAAITANEAEEAWHSSLLGLTEAVKTNGVSLSLHTRAGLQNRDALEAAAGAVREMYLQDIAAGKPIADVTKAHGNRIAALKEEARNLGLDEKATASLIAKYGDVPANVQTTYTTKGYKQIFDELVKLQIAQKALEEGISPDAAMNKYGAKYYGGYAGSPSAFKAKGGPIYGPGTKTSDSVKIMASRGEYMQRASAVDYYGVDFMDALNKQKIPRDALVGGMYANGGLIQVPFKVNVAKTKVPTLAQVTAKLMASGAAVGFPPWPSSPGAQRGDSGVWKSVVKLIKSTGPVSGSFGNGYRPGDPLWHGCVPMDTLVLTRRGWLPFAEIEVGTDETIGCNLETGRSEWTRIVGMYHYEDAELWTIGNDDWRADVTPGHKWLTGEGLIETRTFTSDTRVVLSAPGEGGDVERAVTGLDLIGRRRAEVFCPTTELGTWTARQGDEVFLTGNSGRAVDWMGYNQDALATFLASRKPLELIHRTSKRDYAYTRGKNQGSFDETLMNQHKNHVHAAFAKGGLISPKLFDDGGAWRPGTYGYNGSGKTEHVVTGDMSEQIVEALHRLIDVARGIGGDVGREMNGLSRQALVSARSR